MGLPAAVSETKSPRLKNSQGRVYIISRGSTLIWNFIYDDNVVNGPDWGRSEVVFSLLPDQAALSICSPLCDHSQLTLLVNALICILALNFKLSTIIHFHTKKTITLQGDSFSELSLEDLEKVAGGTEEEL